MGEIYRDRVVGGELRIGTRTNLDHIRIRNNNIMRTFEDAAAGDVPHTVFNDLLKTLKFNGMLRYAGITFSGTVLDGDGNPVPNAPVYLFGVDENGDPLLIAETVTDENGDYEFADIPMYDFDYDSPEATIISDPEGYEAGETVVDNLVDGEDEEDEDIVVIDPCAGDELS